MPFDRRVAAFLAGSFLASFGGWVNFLTILNLATWRFGATPFDLVLLSAALLLPSVLLTRAVGRVCARHAGSAVLVGALAITLGTTGALMHVGHFAAFLAVVALKSAALGFVDPAEMRYVTATLAGARQAGAFRALSLAQSVAKIAAPAAGAVFGAWAGDDRVLLLSMLLIAAAIVLLLLSAPSHARDDDGDGDDEAKTARPRAARTPARGALLPLLCCAATSFAMSAAINNQFPLMLKLRGFDESALGLLVSCAALGGVLGSLLPLRGLDARIGIGALTMPALASALGFDAIGAFFRLPLHPAHALLAGAFFATGLAGARFRIGSRLYVARHLADDVAGASATLQSCAMLAQFGAPCVGALLTSWLPTSDVFFVLGTTAALMLGAIAVVFGPRERRRAVEAVVAERVSG